MPFDSSGTLMAAKSNTRAVKIDADLARKAKIIAEMRDDTSAEYLSKLLRPLIERDWQKTLKEMAQEKPSDN